MCIYHCGRGHKRLSFPRWCSAEMVTFKADKNTKIEGCQVHSWDAATDNIYEVLEIEAFWHWKKPTLPQSPPLLSSDRQNFSHPAVRVLSSTQQSEELLGSFCLMTLHTASRSISWWPGVSGGDDEHDLSRNINSNGLTFSVFDLTTWRCTGSGRGATWRGSPTSCPREWGPSTWSQSFPRNPSRPGRPFRQVTRASEGGGKTRIMDS